VQEVLPRVRAVVPDFSLRVTGPNPPAEVRALEAPGVELIGFVPDLASLYASARVAIAPMRAGAGISIKTQEALRHGVPVVATRLAAEGLGLEATNELGPKDDPVEFASRLVALTTSSEAWSSAREDVLRLLDRQGSSVSRSWVGFVDSALRERTPELVALHARN
jgi:glycosyltransferase involved in cell wall biosynthesis